MKQITSTYLSRHVSECLCAAEKDKIWIERRNQSPIVLMSEEEYLRLSKGYNVNPEPEQHYDNTYKYVFHDRKPPALNRHATAEETTEIASNAGGDISSKKRVVQLKQFDENSAQDQCSSFCSRSCDVSNISHMFKDVNTVLNEIKLLLHNMIHFTNSEEFVRVSDKPSLLSTTTRRRHRTRNERGGSDTPSAQAREYPQEEYSHQKKMLSSKKFVLKLKKNKAVADITQLTIENGKQGEQASENAAQQIRPACSYYAPSEEVGALYENKSPLTDRVCAVFAGYAVCQSEDIFVLDHFIANTPEFQIEDALMGLSSIQKKGYYPRQWSSVIGWIKYQMNNRINKSKYAPSASASTSSAPNQKPTFLTPEGRKDGEVVMGNDGAEYVYISNTHPNYDRALQILNKEKLRGTDRDPWKLGYCFMSKEMAINLSKNPEISLVING
jgi:hypothetical protein